MASTKQQFTPDQILEAGRRAEAQGQFDYAVQFYRHLTENHPRSTEAGFAREALARLTAQVAEGQPPQRNGSTHWPIDTHGHRESQRDPPSRDTAREHARTEKPVEHGRRPRPSDVMRTAFEVPQPAAGFLIGRVLAYLVAAFGSVLAVLGFAMAVIALVAGSLPMVPPVGPPWAAGVVTAVVGLLFLFVGLLALASFASAIAARDSAALLRAIAEDIAGRRW